MEEKTKKLAVNIIGGLIGFGVGLALVSMFIGVLSCDMPLLSAERYSFSLFDKDYSTYGINNIFAIISFIVLLVGGVILCIDASIRNRGGKDIMPLRIAGVAVTAVGTILVLVSGIVLANDTENALIDVAVLAARETGEIPSGISDAELAIIAKQFVTVKIGAGIYLGFIGGLCATIGGVLLLLKPFAASKPAATPNAPDYFDQAAQAQPQNPAEPQAPVATETPDPFAAVDNDNTNNDNNSIL